jgi:hypothetical protein
MASRFKRGNTKMKSPEIIDGHTTTRKVQFTEHIPDNNPEKRENVITSMVGFANVKMVGDKPDVVLMLLA